MKYRLFILSALLCSIPALAFAQGIKVERNVSDGSYTVIGTLEEAKFNQKVIISVSSEDDVVYIGGAETANNGSFLKKFKLSGIEDGEYDIFVGAYDSENPLKDTLYFANPTVVSTALAEVNNALKNGGLVGIMDKNEQILGLDNRYYVDMDSKGKDKIEKILMKNTSYSTAEDFYNDFYDALALAAIMQADENEAKDVVNEFERVLNFEACKTYTLSEELNKKGSNIPGLLAGVDAELVSELHEKFDEKVLLEGIRVSKNIGDAKKIYDTYAEYFDFTEYSMWSLERIAQLTVGRNFESFKALYEYLDKEYAKSGTQSSGGGGSSSGSGNGSSSFTVMPKVQNTIPVPEKKYSFDDLEGYNWAVDAIENLYKMQIISGVGDRTFMPQENVTREQFIKMILSAYGLYEKGHTCKFKDVPQEHWAYSYIACGFDIGIINGFDSDNFGTGKNITRQDMIVITKRAIDKAGVKVESVRENVEFTDNDSISDYAKDAVAEMFMAGVVNGVGDGSFRPENNATRAEAAVIINNLLN